MAKRSVTKPAAHGGELATVALADNFAETFKESRGKVDPALKLGF